MRIPKWIRDAADEWFDHQGDCDRAQASFDAGNTMSTWGRRPSGAYSDDLEGVIQYHYRLSLRRAKMVGKPKKPKPKAKPISRHIKGGRAAVLQRRREVSRLHWTYGHPVSS